MDGFRGRIANLRWVGAAESMWEIVELCGIDSIGFSWLLLGGMEWWMVGCWDFMKVERYKVLLMCGLGFGWDLVEVKGGLCEYLRLGSGIQVICCTGRFRFVRLCGIGLYIKSSWIGEVLSGGYGKTQGSEVSLI